jgi:CRISPR-associated protein Cas1
MKTLLNTLYVTSPDAYLRLEGTTVCVELDHRKVLQVPFHHIGSIVCFGDAIVTPSVMQRCTSEGKSICFLDRTGHFAARVEGPISGNVLLRLGQFKAHSNPVFVLNTARNMVAGKIHNGRQIVLRGAREAAAESDMESLERAAILLAQTLRKLESASSLDQIRGFEGEAARLYFEALNIMVRRDQRDDFTMTNRTRRPPLDRMNAILSFLYTILMMDCRAALECVGLDSQVGFLHALRPGRPALALDLLEEFRPVLSDRVALSLVNRCQLKSSDFTIRPGGAVVMKDESRKTVIGTYQKRKQEELVHPVLGEKMPIGVIPHVQARLLARTIRGDMASYVPYMYR